jgi:Flp pilus assembly protein TadG
MEHQATDHKHGNKKGQKGQIVIAFLGLVPIFIVCLFVVADLARYFYLKNQVRITADSAAVAAAGALDMRQAADNQVFVINENWANARAFDVLTQLEGMISEDDWMTITVARPIISGNEVTVIVNGTGETLFGGYIGISNYSASAIAHARIAVGVDQEW